MSNKKNDNTAVELFAGVGGFRVGLNHVTLKDDIVSEKDNWKIVFANQWEPSTSTQHAFDCYEKRFGKSASHSNKDITKIDANDIPDHKLLVGGFPCQDYSVARTKKGEKGIEGKKGVLWWEIKRIVEAKRPKFVLLENVDRLLKAPSSQRGRDFAIMLYSLNELGYNVEWRVINAAEVGFAQKRRRVFIFASRNNTDYAIRMNNLTLSNIIFNEGIFAQCFPVNQEDFPRQSSMNLNIEVNEDNMDNDLSTLLNKFQNDFKNSGAMRNGEVLSVKTEIADVQFVSLGNILLDNVSNEFTIPDDKMEKFKALRSGKKIQRELEDGTHYFYSEGSMSEYDVSDKPGRTMLTSEGSVNRSTHIIKKDESTFRILHPIEAERLNEFPDDWTNTGMPMRRRYFMMGNALVTGIISTLGDYIRELN